MSRKKLLIVEDEGVTALNLKRILDEAGYYVVHTVPSGEEAVEIAMKSDLDLILMDILLEGEMDGIEAAIRIHEHADIPVIFITANSDEEIVNRAKKAEPYGYIIKPFNKRELRTIVTLAIHRYTLEKKLTDSLEKLKLTLNGAIQAIAKIIEVRDPYTAGHQRRVGKLGLAIAAKMELPDDVREAVYIAGTIHDIGKISVPAEILSKPSKLNESEFSLIKSHPFTGYDILKEIDLPWIIAEVVYQHHERLDGSGYPRGLTVKDMEQESRIISVADVVEAMGSHRPYRASLGIDAALDEIFRKPQWFDRDVVKACRALFLEDNFDFNSEISSTVREIKA